MFFHQIFLHHQENGEEENGEEENEKEEKEEQEKEGSIVRFLTKSKRPIKRINKEKRVRREEEKQYRKTVRDRRYSGGTKLLKYKPWNRK